MSGPPPVTRRCAYGARSGSALSQGPQAPRREALARPGRGGPPAPRAARPSPKSRRGEEFAFSGIDLKAHAPAGMLRVALPEFEKALLGEFAEDGKVPAEKLAADLLVEMLRGQVW